MEERRVKREERREESEAREERTLTSALSTFGSFPSSASRAKIWHKADKSAPESCWMAASSRPAPISSIRSSRIGYKVFTKKKQGKDRGKMQDENQGPPSLASPSHTPLL